MPWKDPEKRKEYRQRPEVKERRKKYRQEYRQRPEVKEKERIRKREYRQRPEVKEKTKNEMREYRQRPENLEKERIRDRKRYAENPEKRKRKYILWAEKNHEYLHPMHLMRKLVKRRKVRKGGILGSLRCYSTVPVS